MDYLLPSDETMRRMANEYAKIKRIGVPQKTVAFSVEEEGREPVPVPRPRAVEPLPRAVEPLPRAVEPQPRAVEPTPSPIVIEPDPNPIGIEPLPEEEIVPRNPDRLPQLQQRYELSLQCTRTVALFWAFVSLMRTGC